MLFNEIYSGYYLATSSILREALKGTLTKKKFADIVNKYAFGESFVTILAGLQGGKWHLLDDDFTPKIENIPVMPLSILQKRWLKSLISDPRIKLFEPDISGLDDVEPLFDKDMIVYYDRYTDGDDYDDENYIAVFRIILRALRERKNLRIIFETRLHEAREINITPHYLEYSEKDDRFRLVGADEKFRWIVNLSRIINCEIINSGQFYELPEGIIDSVTFELIDRWNAMERVLLHFSHLQRETKRLDENKYRVTIYYDHYDETEVLIRILSFGSTIRVMEPESFITRLKERIDRQRELTKA
ncbi:MAG: WYL domain-containing protein [Synergistaceae bacterium]|nr:WYL domain-containing protein [Synergistaceae bacterium]